MIAPHVLGAIYGFMRAVRMGGFALGLLMVGMTYTASLTGRVRRRLARCPPTRLEEER